MSDAARTVEALEEINRTLREFVEFLRSARLETEGEMYARMLGKKPASEGGKAECNPWDHVWSWGECQTCKPAPPEPVAAEMPEAVLVNTWQLEELLKYADLAEVSIRTGFAPPSFLGVDLPYLLRNAIAAVRAQAAEAGIKLPKVREGISLLIWKIDNAQGAIAVEHYSGMLRSMLAELDTAEGRK